MAHSVMSVSSLLNDASTLPTSVDASDTNIYGKAAYHGAHQVYTASTSIGVSVEVPGTSYLYINRQDRAGRTALYIAAAIGDITTVNLPLEEKAKYLECEAVDGTTALMAAIIKDHHRVASLLLEHGSKALHESLDGHTPLSLAMIKPAFRDLVPGMLERMIPQDIRNLKTPGCITLFESCIEVRNRDRNLFENVLHAIRRIDREVRECCELDKEIWKKIPFLTSLLYEMTDELIESKLKEVQKMRKDFAMIPILSPIFRGRYMLEHFLGNGSFSSAWKVLDLVTGTHLAAKFIMKKLSIQELIESRYEADLMRTMDHPNVLKCQGFSPKNQCPVMITELAEEGDLRMYLRRNHSKFPIPQSKAKNIFRQIVKAVEHMHARDIVHRDLKTENILYFDQDVVKIADFGNSKLLAIEDNGNLTDMPCTPLYRAPESAKYKVERTSRRPFAAKPCDMWSAGVILYEMLVNKMPFDCPPGDHHDDNHLELYSAICAGDLNFDSDLWEGIDDQAMHLIARILEVNPAYRPTATQVLLHPWLDEDSDKGSTLDFTNLRKPHATRVGTPRKETFRWIPIEQQPAAIPASTVSASTVSASTVSASTVSASTLSASTVSAAQAPMDKPENLELAPLLLAPWLDPRPILPVVQDVVRYGPYRPPHTLRLQWPSNQNLTDNAMVRPSPFVSPRSMMNANRRLPVNPNHPAYAPGLWRQTPLPDVPEERKRKRDKRVQDPKKDHGHES